MTEKDAKGRAAAKDILYLWKAPSGSHPAFKTLHLPGTKGIRGLSLGAP